MIQSRSASEESEEEKEGIPHPLVTLSKIDPDEIPEVPSNRFLYRGDKKVEEEEADSKKSKKLSPEEEERMREKRRAQIRGRTRTGRKIKGRGLLVILTASLRNAERINFICIINPFAEVPDTFA